MYVVIRSKYIVVVVKRIQVQAAGIYANCGALGEFKLSRFLISNSTQLLSGPSIVQLTLYHKGCPYKTTT